MPSSIARSSIPSYRPATSSSPGRPASSCALAWSKTSPCAERQILGLPAGSLACAARIAARSGSGLSTIPGPPPYGRSSTVRCGSLVCALTSSVPTRASPRSIARPTTPCASAPRTISGKSVTTSICMTRYSTPRLLEHRRPVHNDPTCAEVHRAQVPGSRRNPVLPLAPHHHQRACGRLDEVLHHPERLALEVPNRKPDEVRAIELPLTRGRQRLTCDLDRGTAQRLGGGPVFHSRQAHDETFALPAPLDQPVLGAAIGRAAQAPSLETQQPLGRLRVGLHVQPARDAEG